MRKQLQLILFCTALFCHTISAESQIDSLKGVIATAKTDTSICNAYLRWGEQVYLSNPDTAKTLWQKAHEVASTNLSDHHSSLRNTYLALSADALNNVGFIYGRLGDNQNALEYYAKSLHIREKLSLSSDETVKRRGKAGLAESFNNMGYIYFVQGFNDKALDNYDRSLNLLNDLGDSSGISDALNNIGLVHYAQGDSEKALEYYHESLKIQEEAGDKRKQASTLNNLAYIYKDQGDTQMALAYFNKSLKLRVDINDKKGMSNSLNNIGVIYDDLGDYSSALDYFLRSLNLKKDIGDKHGIAVAYNNLAGIYYLQGDPNCQGSKEECLQQGINIALDYFQQALQIHREADDKQGESYTLNNIGRKLLHLGRIAAAKENALLSMKLAKHLGYPVNIKRSALLLSDIYRSENDFKNTLEMYELHIQMRDSIKNEETQKASIRQQTKYEFEKALLVKEQAEKENARLVAEKTARRDNLQYSVVLICLLSIGVLVAFLGRLSLPERVAEGLIFFAFLLFFEFLLVLADPYIEDWSGGAPGFKLLFNAAIAALIFPLHAFFEVKLKKRLVN